MRSKYLASFILVAVTIMVYWQTGNHGFINFDDPEYVYENPYVKMGLTPATIKWAFTTFYASNWHPLTWLSHMTDVQLYDMHPFGHHITNVVLHSANVLLLFLLLLRLTGFPWRSMTVAALFALHPLHVESVAWISERKDVLSAFFWLMTLHLYAGYAKKPGWRRYLLMVVTFAFGLMAKPMLVTLPIVLMLLDYWPLGRWRIATGNTCAARLPFRKLVLEKLPFFVLAGISSLLTLWAQHEGGAVNSLDNYSITMRIANAITSYSGYLCKMVWPWNLAIFYPLPKAIPIMHVLGAGCFFAVMTFISIRVRRKQPFMVTGWLWYVVTLVPVIGLIQVGAQSSADRYTYLPLIGIFILVVWWACEFSLNLPYRSRGLILTLIGGIMLTACAFVTLRQISFWQNDVTLFSHALAVTNDNFIAHNNLGFALAREDKLFEAAAHFNEAIRISPRFADAYTNLGEIFLKTGDIDDSISYLSKAIDLRPHHAATFLDMGVAMFRKGNIAEALNSFDRALAIDSFLGDGYYNKGIVLSTSGKTDEAIECFTAALKINPDNPDYHTHAGMELARRGRTQEAINHFSEALRLNPNEAGALRYLNNLHTNDIIPNVTH